MLILQMVSLLLFLFCTQLLCSLLLLLFLFNLKLDDEVRESHEFVSDTMQPSTQDLIEVQEGMKRLTMGGKRQGMIMFLVLIL